MRTAGLATVGNRLIMGLGYKILDTGEKQNHKVAHLSVLLTKFGKPGFKKDITHCCE
jgi:hypothetical protein